MQYQLSYFRSKSFDYLKEKEEGKTVSFQFDQKL